MANDPRGVSDGPSLSETQWYSLAVTTAIFTLICLMGSAAYIFVDGFDGDSDLKLTQALSPFGVALFAVVTFCTAGWRGSINVRQANQAESEGRAKLLQEGAKMLSEASKPSHVSAGAATLGVLVAGPDREYALQAMSLLQDFVEDHMSRNHSNRHRAEVSSILKRGVDRGVVTGRSIAFDCTDFENQHPDEEVFWSYISGFAENRYYGGVFPYDKALAIEELRNVFFNTVRIAGWPSVSLDRRFNGCYFTDCEIVALKSVEAYSHYQSAAFAFGNCDFSGCVIDNLDDLPSTLKSRNNFYIDGHPPRLSDHTTVVDWEIYLHCVERKPQRSMPI